MSFNRELFLCVYGHLEELKLSVATEITMMELHYVSDSCKPISYLEDNFRPKSHIHLLLFWFCASCIGFVLAHTHSFAWNNPQALISPLDYLFAFGLEFVQCLWHFPLTRNERRFDRHRSVPKTVWSSARKTHFWQFADDEKILQWAQVVLCAHTHTRHNRMPNVWTCEMECDVRVCVWVCLCQYANIFDFRQRQQKEKEQLEISWTIALNSSHFFC